MILDSITHEWSGVGGCLEMVDALGKGKFKGNSWGAWSEVTPEHRKFIDAMLHSSINIIVTMRSKMETVQTNDGGKKKVEKLGLKAEQLCAMVLNMNLQPFLISITVIISQ